VYRIVIDTREQNGYSFSVPAVRRKLDAGDYSVEGFEERVAVERKSLPDFVRTVIHARRRFHAELRRLTRYEFACIVVEGSQQDIQTGKYPGRAHPNAILGSATSICVDWGIPVHFCGNRQTARQFVEEFLLQCHAKLNPHP